MATFNVKSTIISNRDATPKVLTDPYVYGGTGTGCEGYVQTGSAADAASTTYRLCQVPSNARVDTVKMSTDALGTGCTLDVGVWWPTFIPVGAGLTASLASTVINTQLFASALACSNSQAAVDITNQSTNYTIKNQELPLWSAAGLTSDPGIDLDIVAYVHVANQIQGYVGLKVYFQF
jgi:hypothetical protein